MATIGTKAVSKTGTKTRLSHDQLMGFGASWLGWILDGMDSFIFALVLVPAVSELLPASGFAVNHETIGEAGTILFAVFLVGWGCAIVWGPVADRFGRTKTLAAAVLMYAVFTALCATSHSVYELGIYRFLAGLGVGGNWALSGTYVAESMPEDRRVKLGGILNAGYYIGFFIATALNYTIGAAYGWRALFLCGIIPAIVGFVTLTRVKESDTFKTGRRARHVEGVKEVPEPGQVKKPDSIFDRKNRRATITMSIFGSCSIIGVWAGAVYAPSAVRMLAEAHGMVTGPASLPHIVSLVAALLSLFTIIGNVALPYIAEAAGRKVALSVYFVCAIVGIVGAFGWAFYLNDGFVPFTLLMIVLGFAGGNFAMYNIWIPELFPTSIRATAFAFAVSVGRFVAAGVNFLLAAAVASVGSIGVPIAFTAVAFGVGLLVMPFAIETKGRHLPA